MRKGYKLYPQGDSAGVGWPDVEYEVLETALTWWETELRRSELFFAENEENYSDVGKERPTLRELLSALENLAI